MAAGDDRSVTIPLRVRPDGGTDALEGIFASGDPDAGGALVAPPHPLYGGSIDSPVVTEVAYACRKAGLASLVFNWRGVGASAGEPSGDAADADEDYRAALEHLEKTVAPPLVACGYSFGAAAALRCARGRATVRRMILVAPPPSILDAAALASFTGKLLVIAGARDAIAPPGPLEPLVAAAPKGRLEVIDGADHFFGVGLATIGQHVTAWFD